ncbi:uncharacterized protein LOC131689391 isoform X2 [Topomyia yanbarensis]|uniref:uncharacterized protein LOC131689391 isoform X2 n=1 Tax=Topomyia yanbarensis TaxID=2498891 RepID=UPI00273BFDB6|nr:uncharacterized protein LOC131689391 isoform X2 [Topomyia yanbarensis]
MLISFDSAESTQDQPSLHIVKIQKADVSQLENTVMDIPGAVEFVNTDDELLEAVQHEPDNNIETAWETCDNIPHASSNPTERNAEPSCMTEHRTAIETISMAVSEELVHLLKQSQNSDAIDRICNTTDDFENQSPNTSQKRVPSEDVYLQKSTKKNASTEMKFRCFNINWNKIGDHLMDRLKVLQEFKNNSPDVFPPASIRITRTEVSTLTNAVIDQLRMIDSQIRAETMETVSRQIIEKFPAMDYTDDDGFGAGQGYVELKYKMINRNNYLNRFQNGQASTSNAVTSLKKKRNARAGTLKEYWVNSSNQCDKCIQSKLARDEPNLLSNEVLLQSQAYVRFKLDEKIDTAKMVSQFTVLRRRLLLNFHFEKATGVNVSNFRRYFVSKKQKIIQYSLTCKPNLHLKESSSDYEILQFLCSLVGENFSEIIIQKEIGTRIDDIIIGSAGPVLVAVDIGNSKTVFYVYANEARLSEGTCDVITAMEDLFTIHFVHNFMYVKPISKFLELLQEYFLKIITFVASKSTASRVGQRQRVVRKVISALSNSVA